MFLYERSVNIFGVWYSQRFKLLLKVIHQSWCSDVLAIVAPVYWLWLLWDGQHAARWMVSGWCALIGINDLFKSNIYATPNLSIVPKRKDYPN